MIIKSAVVFAAPAEEIPPSSLYAKAAVLMDGESGRVLYEKNASEVLPMASTTKIMTCITALEYGNLDDLVEISPYAASMPAVKLSVRAGELYLLSDLLYALMLESDNDVAVGIAEYISNKLGLIMAEDSPIGARDITKSKEAVLAFANLMNEKARSIGCYDTCFITPNGLDATVSFYDDLGNTVSKTHSTTATDLARIMKYCIGDSPKSEDFLKITRTASHSFNNRTINSNGAIGQGGRSFSCNNHNAFLSMMEGALSGKTGFTGNAGYCYIGSLRRDGRTYIVALLACGWPNHKTYKWSDTTKLMNYGLANFSYKTLRVGTVPSGGDETDPSLWNEAAFEQIQVLNADTGDGYAYVDAELSAADNAAGIGSEIKMLMRPEESIKANVRQFISMDAPINAGDIVGRLSYEFEDGSVINYPIIAKEKVGRVSLAWCLRKVLRLAQV